MRIPAIVALTVLLAACNSNSPNPDMLRATAANAVANPARGDQDRRLDDRRKPIEVLTFFQIQPGMKVLDVFGGSGYYTEIISYLVGPEGSVTLYNNNPWDNFVKVQVSERLESDRLPNVESLIAPPEELIEVDEQYDAAIFILGMHDIYYEDLANGWQQIDVDVFLQDIHRLIKPGGILGIIDHNAAAGTDPAIIGKTLHRVDPARVVEDLEAVGFRLEAESDILRNPDDDLTGLVFSPQLRWKSDRSVLRFRRR